MIRISEVYKDVVSDNVNETENGYFSYERFNRMSKRAELRMIDYLTGGLRDLQPPLMQSNQKMRDWLAPFVESKSEQVSSNGQLTLPQDYYIIDNAYLLNEYDKADCEEITEEVKDCATPIEILRSDEFYDRCNTFIEGLKPSVNKPIAKRVGRIYKFMPRDLGTIGIDYVRYPKYGRIESMLDTTYNNMVVDEQRSSNYEWDEAQREFLVWFITDTFAIHTREQALKQQNLLTGKSARDQEMTK